MIISPGMTDLLAPLLSTLDNDSEAFFCFTQLVEKTVFFKPAKNSVSVERQVVSVCQLDVCTVVCEFVSSECVSLCQVSLCQVSLCE